MKNTGRKTVKGDKVSAPKAVKAMSSKTTDEAKPAAANPAAANPAAANPAAANPAAANPAAANPAAAKPAAMTSATVPKSTSAPTHEEIAQRSYELYLARGSIDGHAENDWARAESELRSR